MLQILSRNHDAGFVGEELQPRGKSKSYAPERSISLPAEAVHLSTQDGKIAEDISLSIRRELERIAYLGPLRRKPERDYVWNGSRPGDIGSDGSKLQGKHFSLMIVVCISLSEMGLMLNCSICSSMNLAESSSGLNTFLVIPLAKLVNSRG